MTNKAKWKNFSEEEIKKIVAESRSYRDIAIRMGYAPDGGSSSKKSK